jgi:hypothetical protein
MHHQDRSVYSVFQHGPLTCPSNKNMSRATIALGPFFPHNKLTTPFSGTRENLHLGSYPLFTDPFRKTTRRLTFLILLLNYLYSGYYPDHRSLYQQVALLQGSTVPRRSSFHILCKSVDLVQHIVFCLHPTNSALCRLSPLNSLLLTVSHQQYKAPDATFRWPFPHCCMDPHRVLCVL